MCTPTNTVSSKSLSAQEETLHYQGQPREHCTLTAHLDLAVPIVSLDSS